MTPKHTEIWAVLQNRLEHKIKAAIKAKVLQLLDSGAINFDNYPTNSVELADLLLTAALEDIVSKRLQLATPKTRKELKNLEKF
ncbi:MAG: hypothetical protein IM613_12050 [Cytophagales bacterium]|jgi:hypothetical protein|nr:hypothetical protein [Cytophagales bacterium]